MAIAVIVVIGFLVMLGFVLFIVDRRRPAIFRLKATFTRWVSFDLEMCSPEDGSKEGMRTGRASHRRDH